MSNNNTRFLLKTLRKLTEDMIDENLGEINAQLNMLGTYDVAIWESTAHGFIRINKILSLLKKTELSQNVINGIERSVTNRLESAMDLIFLSRNPYHVTLAFSSMLFPAYELSYEKFESSLEEIIKIIDEIPENDRKVRAISRILGAISRIFYEKRKERAWKDDFLQSIAEELSKKAFQLLDAEKDELKRTALLISFADAIKNMGITVKKDDLKVTWIDADKAENLAFEALERVKNLDKFSASLIKARIAYLLRSLSIDLASKANELFDEAITTAIELSAKDPVKTGHILGEVAFYKAVLGDEDEAEVFFEQSIIAVLSGRGISQIIDALIILEKAGRAKLGQKVISMLEDYILPRINAIRDPFIRIGLKAYAADVASWVSFDYGERLLEQTISELFYYEPVDVKSSIQIYYLALGTGRAAFTSAEKSIYLLEFIIDYLSLLRDFPSVYVPKQDFYWIGKALASLRDVPEYYDRMFSAISDVLRSALEVLSDTLFIDILLDLAIGFRNKDAEVVNRFMSFFFKNIDSISKKPKLIAKLSRYAKLIGEEYYQGVVRAIQEHIERMNNPKEIIFYLHKFFDNADSETAEELLRYSLDLFMEMEDEVRSMERSVVTSFIERAREINPKIAEGLEEIMNVEERTRDSIRSDISSKSGKISAQQDQG